MDFLRESRITYPVSSVAGIGVGKGDFSRVFPVFPGVKRPAVMPRFWVVVVPYVHLVWLTAILPVAFLWSRFVGSPAVGEGGSDA